MCSLSLLLSLGCGLPLTKSVTAVAANAVAGSVSGGQQPIVGASVQLYAVGDSDTGAASAPLLAAPATTSSTGTFSLGSYTCPDAATNVYLTATGGSTASQAGEKNASLVTMAALGACGQVAGASHLAVNELSTIAAVYALAPFMKSYSEVGAGPNSTQLLNDAFQMAAQMVNKESGAVPGTAVSGGQSVPAEKIRALANSLTPCINSRGGTAGDGSACGALFALASQTGASPTNLVTALLNIANNPLFQVGAIFSLNPAAGPFQPSLAAPPTDWALLPTSPVAAPKLSPAPGVYPSETAITLASASAGSKIFYTTDGSTPTTSSRLYSGAIPLSATSMIRAISVAAGMSSMPVAGLYTIARPVISLSPKTVSLAAAKSQSFDASVTGAANSAVTWAMSPAVGTLTSRGVYTAPATIGNSQVVTITATSVADPSVSTASQVTLVAPITVGVAPLTATLNPSQVQNFTATVTGAANGAVTWSLNPAIGSITSNGAYTAPASVSSAQKVTVIATSVANPAVSAVSAVTIEPPATASLPVVATASSSSYYMAPNGSDTTGNGTQARPWLTPNHPGLTCGDTITAASGTYPTFTISTTPACSTHNAVFVQCAVFATCKVNGSQSQGGILVQASYGAVMGWEVTTPHGSSDYASCFQATPKSTPIHDIYFINDIANGCQAGGFTSSNSVDYFAAVADIAYNASQGNSYCYSGFSVYQPLASDTAPGTHIYLSQLFAWNNVDPTYCQGGNSTDGEGVIFDTFNGAQGGQMPYQQQAVIDNVIAIFNGAGGVYEGGSGNSGATIYMRHNTAYGNFTNTNQNTTLCGQIQSVGFPTNTRQNMNVKTQMVANLAVAPAGGRASGCGGNPAYAYLVGNVDGTTTLTGNAGYSSVGNNIGMDGLVTGFSPGATNLFGLNPAFANPVQPAAPACAGSANVIACMAKVIADFTPTNPLLSTYGYHAPSPLPVVDPLFPKWLCNSNIPPGLTTMGCLNP